MTYQSIILGAGAPKNLNSDFRKCNFLIDGNKTLLEFSINSFISAHKTIVALNPFDYHYFEQANLVGSPVLLNISKPTQGALATSGMCLDLLSENLPIIVSAVDGICIGVIEPFLRKMLENDADGGVVVFPSINLNYSYVRSSHGFPIEFAEKSRIGELATAGIFYFKNKQLLVDSILWAILKQIKHKDTYYLSAAMNKFIFEGKRVILFETTEGNYYRFSTEDEAANSRDRLKVNYG